MHRRPEVELLPLDTELERTLRNLKKVGIDEALVMADQRETHRNEKSTKITRITNQKTLKLT